MKYEQEMQYNPDKDLGHDAAVEAPRPGTLNFQKLAYGASFVVGSVLIYVLLQSTIGILAIPVMVTSCVLMFLVGAKSKSFRTGGRMYRELVKLCHDDKEVAERLIHAEFKKNINIRRAQAISLAHDRLLRDRLR